VVNGKQAAYFGFIELRRFAGNRWHEMEQIVGISLIIVT